MTVVCTISQNHLKQDKTDLKKFFAHVKHDSDTVVTNLNHLLKQFNAG